MDSTYAGFMMTDIILNSGLSEGNLKHIKFSLNIFDDVLLSVVSDV